MRRRMLSSSPADRAIVRPPRGGRTTAFGRRDCLALLAALLAAPIHRAKAGSAGPRIAALDWTLAEMVLSLGLDLIAVTEVDGYRRWVGEPALPGGAVELGLRTTPNLELLQQLAPDLIVANPAQAETIPALDSIAPCVTATIYFPDGQPFRHAQQELLRLGQALDRADAASRVIANADAAIASARARVGGFGRPLYMARFVDPNHLMIFGQNNILQDVLDRTGLRNAWDGPETTWGFSIVGPDQLDAADAHLLYLGIDQADLDQAARDSAIWRSLPFFRNGRISVLPPVWFFGGVWSAMRFAQGLETSLDQVKG
jgi:ABC-type Fe3+-hydroxamate transport system substrate-binding protein